MPVKSITFTICIFLFVLTGHCQVCPLPNAFAHNDYLHKRPLFEALDNGYTNIEADIFLHKGKLVVAHYFPYFKGKRTLENLYIAPLFKYLNDHNGEIYTKYNKPITLMIDIKTNANKTYAALKDVLKKYPSMFSSYNDGVFTPGKVTVVLSGKKPSDIIMSEKCHIAFIDEDLKAVLADTTRNDIFMMASCKYSNLIKWKGDGAMPIEQCSKLCNYTKRAHQKGEKVRLWASPENPTVWRKLLDCGVDYINTDKLAALKDYLVAATTLNKDMDRLKQIYFNKNK